MPIHIRTKAVIAKIVVSRPKYALNKMITGEEHKGKISIAMRAADKNNSIVRRHLTIE